MRHRLHALKHSAATAHEGDTHENTSVDGGNMGNVTSICQTLINQAYEIIGPLHNYQLGVGDVDRTVPKIISMMKLRVRPEDCSKQEQMVINLVEGKFTA